MQIPKGKVEEAQRLVQGKAQHLQDQFGLKEAQLSISLETSSATSKTVLLQGDALRLTALLLVLPHGVAKMSHAVSGLSPLHCFTKFRIVHRSSKEVGLASLSTDVTFCFRSVKLL